MTGMMLVDGRQFPVEDLIGGTVSRMACDINGLTLISGASKVIGTFTTVYPEGIKSVSPGLAPLVPTPGKQ
jgi:hypothetical protein